MAAIIECFPELFSNVKPTPASTNDSANVLYNGSAPACFIAVSGDDLETIIEGIDAALCDIKNTLLSSISTSDVTLYDGTPSFSCFTVSGTLNDVINQIGDKICSIDTFVNNLGSDDINYTGSPTFSCFAISGDLNDVIDKLGNEICDLESASVNDVSFGFLALNLNDTITDHVNSGGDNAGPVGLTFNISGPGGNSVYYDAGQRSVIADTGVSLTASVDNYIDAANDGIGGGSYIVTTVPIGNPAPVLAGLRIWKIETDGVGVVTATDVRVTDWLDGGNILATTVPASAIVANAITTAQMDALITPGTTVAANVTVDASGRITTLSSDFIFSGPTVDQYISFNGTKWVNQNIVGNLLPSASDNFTFRFDSGDWVSASNLINTGSEVGIGTITPFHELTMGVGKVFAMDMEVPQNPAAVAVTGGALPAQTFFYVILAQNTLKDTAVSAEVNATADGGPLDQIDINWDDVPGATSYVIYRGIVTGVFTEEQTVGTNSHSDTGAGWIAATAFGTNEAMTVFFDSSADANFILNRIGFGRVDPLSGVHINTSLSLLHQNIAFAASPYLTDEDLWLNVNTAGGPVTITLSTADTVLGRVIVIKDNGNATTNNVTVATEGAQTIDGAASKVLNTDFDKLIVISDGAQWFVLSD